LFTFKLRSLSLLCRSKDRFTGSCILLLMRKVAPACLFPSVSALVVLFVKTCVTTKRAIKASAKTTIEKKEYSLFFAILRITVGSSVEHRGRIQKEEWDDHVCTRPCLLCTRSYLKL